MSNVWTKLLQCWNIVLLYIIVYLTSVIMVIKLCNRQVETFTGYRISKQNRKVYHVNLMVKMFSNCTHQYYIQCCYLKLIFSFLFIIINNTVDWSNVHRIFRLSRYGTDQKVKMLSSFSTTADLSNMDTKGIERSVLIRKMYLVEVIMMPPNY